MDANARRPGGSTRGTLGVALAVVALVAVVAIASGGSVPHGAIGARRPSEGLLDTAVSLFVVAMALGTVLVVVMVSVFGRRELDGVARKRPSTLRSLITLLVGLGLLGLAVRVLGGSVERRFGHRRSDATPERAARTAPRPRRTSRSLRSGRCWRSARLPPLRSPRGG